MGDLILVFYWTGYIARSSVVNQTKSKSLNKNVRSDSLTIRSEANLQFQPYLSANFIRDRQVQPNLLIRPDELNHGEWTYSATVPLPMVYNTQNLWT
jgi:hypothetical protein